MSDDAPSVTAPPAPPPGTMESELTRINQEMYEQNVELAIRNRTLSILRKIYDIINTAYGVQQTAQKLSQAIVEELKFRTVSIALVDKKNNLLQAVATYPNKMSPEQEIQYLGSPFSQIQLSLSHTENYCVNAIVHKQTRMTNTLFDVFCPLVSKERAMQLQEVLSIQTSIIYPILFAGESLGVLVIGLEKHIGDLSRAEQETLKELINVASIAIERAQIYEDLQQANERLTQMDKLKDEFISIVSHELRTPMTAIRSYAWMVIHERGGKLQPKAMEYMNRVYLSTERLINLVNDMLDVSRIESGRVQLKSAPFDLVQLANEVQSEFQARSTERNLQVLVSYHGTISQVFGDREKVHQVLENLVGNAFKFTPNGGTITMDICEKDGMILTGVIDTGKGIAPEDMKKLFTKFGRLDNSLVSISESGGTGLGLFICKQYIEMHKGKIWAESEVGKGTTFFFTLPITAK